MTMAGREAIDEAGPATNRWLPYALVGIGLPVGLLVVLVEPLPWPVMNHVVGGVFLAVAVGSVAHLIVRHSGPGERGPDF